ncbi:MAG: class I SAM-dependent methyltransferase [Anaerolineales bacterium]|nr:class I SAM-dependent methyltransferase [Anaerolineales bacterium]
MLDYVRLHLEEVTMPVEDAQRWNKRYAEGLLGGFERPRPFLVKAAALLPGHGLALDVAMGLGGNAAFLLARGWQVVGVDISQVAVHRAKAQHPGLWAVVADMTRFHLPEATFDLVLNFYYLQRELFPLFERALKPGGLLIFETLTCDMQAVHPDIDPVYLLERGELRRAFQDWEVLIYREGWQQKESDHPRAVASLAARRR